MKIIQSVLFILLLTLFFTSCKDEDELYTDPNSAEHVPPSSVLTGILLDMYQWPFLSLSQNSAFNLSQHFVNIQSYYSNQNYLFGEANFQFGILRNVVQMEKEAARQGTKPEAVYKAMGKFFRAYFFCYMTERVGDIPMSHALKGEDNIFTPKYDTQKDVYKQCLMLLEEANNELATLINAGEQISSGDVFFDGDLQKWQKVVNSFKLRILMSLSLRSEDSDLNIKQQFASIVNDPGRYPIFESNADNMSIHYYDNADNKNPSYPEKRPLKELYAFGDTYVSLVKALKDPRLFVVASPAPSLNVGVPGRDTLFSSYAGGKSGDDIDQLGNETIIEGKYSTINYDYWYHPVIDPTIQIGYPEMEFTVAEAINRGWISGNAAELYYNGITASMTYYGLSEAKISAYLSNPDVVYKGDNQEGFQQILNQKYIAFLNHSGHQSFFDQRRTGIPTFDIGPANANDQKIPKRWKYPDDEVKYNSEELSIALERQFGGADDINGVMWSIKP